MIRRIAIGVAGAAMALSVTGCLGGGGGKGSPATGTDGGLALVAANITKASEKAGGIHSFRATMAMDMSISSPQQGRIQMDGRLAFQSRPKPAMKLDFSTMTINGKDIGNVQEILLGDSLYMKMPALSERAGKPWVRMSLSKAAGKSGVDLSALTRQSQQADPAANLRMFTASKDARQLGTETIDGVPTTHYQGTFSLKQALAKLPGDQQAKTRQLIDQAGVDTMSFDLWADGQSYPRRLITKIPPGRTMGMTLTVTYSDFNAPVAITAPPAGQVADGDS